MTFRVDKHFDLRYFFWKRMNFLIHELKKRGMEKCSTDFRQQWNARTATWKVALALLSWLSIKNYDIVFRSLVHTWARWCILQEIIVIFILLIIRWNCVYNCKTWNHKKEPNSWNTTFSELSKWLKRTTKIYRFLLWYSCRFKKP